MTDETENNQDEKVGYKKPPRKHRFQTGVSGNYGGRPPKKKVSVEEQLTQLLSETHLVTIGGVQRRVANQELMLRAVIQKALKGDLRANSFVLGLRDRYAANSTDLIKSGDLAPEDLATLQHYLDKVSASAPQIRQPEVGGRGDDS